MKLNASGEYPNSFDDFKLTEPTCQYAFAVDVVDLKLRVQSSVINGIKLIERFT